MIDRMDFSRKSLSKQDEVWQSGVCSKCVMFKAYEKPMKDGDGECHKYRMLTRHFQTCKSFQESNDE